MSIEERILEYLSTPRRSYKGVAVGAFGIPLWDGTKKKTIQNRIALLKKRKYVTVFGPSIKVTEEGKKYYAKRKARLRSFNSPFGKAAAKNLILMFDIPEARKAEREWLRRQLGVFGYSMIQKSVWVGPSPLPAEFEAYLKRIGLGVNLKAFKLARPYDDRKIGML